MKLFRPFESRNDNVLGYVRHSYDKSSLYQTIGNFFIGIAPLIFGIIVILILITFIAKIFGVSNIFEDKLVKFNIFVACFMGIGIFFSLITLGVSFILSCIFK